MKEKEWLRMEAMAMAESAQCREWLATLSGDCQDVGRRLYAWAYWALACGVDLPTLDELEKIELFLIVQGCPQTTKASILFGLQEV